MPGPVAAMIDKLNSAFVGTADVQALALLKRLAILSDRKTPTAVDPGSGPVYLKLAAGLMFHEGRLAPEAFLVLFVDKTRRNEALTRLQIAIRHDAPRGYLDATDERHDAFDPARRHDILTRLVKHAASHRYATHPLTGTQMPGANARTAQALRRYLADPETTPDARKAMILLGLKAERAVIATVAAQGLSHVAIGDDAFEAEITATARQTPYDGVIDAYRAWTRRRLQAA